MRHNLFTAIGLLLLLGSVEARSQSVTSSKDPGQWALIYSDELEKNKKALSGYTWQYRVEVNEGGEFLYVDTLEATRDSTGNLQTVTVEQDVKIKERHGLLAKAGQEKRFAEIQGKIDFLRGVIHNYVYMSRGQVVDFFDSARVTEAVGYTNALRVDGEGVLKEGDSITLYGDKGTAHPLYLAFQVPFDNNVRVDGSVEFRKLRNSNLFYGARITAYFVEHKPSGKAKEMSITVESFDFQKK